LEDVEKGLLKNTGDSEDERGWDRQHNLSLFNYGHYSIPRLIENLWSLAPISSGPDYCCGDIGAVAMTDILG